MTLDEAVAAFERKFEKVVTAEKPEECIGHAPNGARYVTMTASGIKEEGEPFAGFFDNEEEAAIMWGVNARDFAAGNSTLYWREKPSICRCRKMTDAERADEERHGFKIKQYEDVISDETGPLYQVWSRMQVE